MINVDGILGKSDLQITCMKHFQFAHIKYYLTTCLCDIVIVQAFL